MSMDDVFPPFEPDGPEPPERKRLREISVRYLIPNAITVLAICAGLSAVRMAIEERFETAIGLILLAAILDGLDGRAARLLKASSKFGAEMDSLADAINFGCVPALVLYVYVLDETKQFGWIAALIYVIACVLRLARFNVMTGDSARPKWQREFFIGIPAPAGAMLVLLPVYVGFLGVSADWITASIVSLYTIIIGFLMVSNLPVWSAKSVGGISRTAVMPVLLLIVLLVAALANFTWVTLAVVAVAYLAFLPYSVHMYRKAKKKAEQEPQSEAAS